MSEHFEQLLRHSPLGILADLDGTLIPFAETPDKAIPDPATHALVDDLSALPDVTFVIISGRTREQLERYFPSGVFLVAEHGAFRRGPGAWEPLRDEAVELKALRTRMEALVLRYPRAWVEQKSTSLVLHYRALAPREREAFAVEATAMLDAFAAQYPNFERTDAVLAMEVKPSYIRKSSAVPWVRERAGHGARLLAIGDDLTDEHMFGALAVGDEAIVVRHGERRRTRARFELQGPDEVRSFLRQLVALRKGERSRIEPLPRLVHAVRSRERVSQSLLVVSNRLPNFRGTVDGRPASVGGLVTALRSALETRNGLWLGWNGEIVDDADEPSAVLDEDSRPGTVGIDMKERWYRDYYNGFCNSALWPLFHCFPGRVHFARNEWVAYEEVHDLFADVARRYVDARGTIWVHDYHLLLLARDLRARGHTGPLGHFLHIPFPPPDLFEMLPWRAEILDSLLAFDLLGFQTPTFMRNFLASVGAMHFARVSDDAVEYRERRTRTGVFPIGIMPSDYRDQDVGDFSEELEGLFRILGPARLVLGVDRLDYTKGIPERLLAFGRMLDLHPELRTHVSLVQISVPSRADVPHYAEQRARIEEIVGRINGQYGEAHWVPVQYFYRGYEHPQLARLYRAAAVGYVTPLRDGMNLVAKEYVAAQNPEDPGVLLLSRFAGAAVELKDALLTNPYHVDGMADDLHRALVMPKSERLERHRKLLAHVESQTALSWSEAFLNALAATR